MFLVYDVMFFWGFLSIYLSYGAFWANLLSHVHLFSFIYFLISSLYNSSWILFGGISSLEVQVNLLGAYILLSDSLLVGYSTWFMLVLFLDTTESFGMSGLGSLLYASSYLESSANNVSLRMSYPLFQTNFSSLG